MALRPGGPADRVGKWQRGEDGGGAKGPITPKYPKELPDAIRQSAKDLGVSDRDLATAISYETGGTFDPWKRGPTTKWGTHHGLIQWGEPQARRYGVSKDTPVGDQMKAVTRYLQDAGVKPGMGLPEIYSAINAGRVGKMNASDRPGFTVRRHVEEMRGPHGRRADRLLAQGGSEAAEAPSAGKAIGGLLRADEPKFDRKDIADKLRALGELEANPDLAARLGYAQEASRRPMVQIPDTAETLGKAVRSGVTGMAPKFDANGRVDVHIERPGPDTRVRTNTDGNLFKEIRLNRGRAMAQASQDS